MIKILKNFLSYLVKPPLYIRFDDIDNVNFAKGSTSRKSFELEFQVKGDGGNKTTYTFQNIGREEYQPMFDFCQAKNIRIKNVKEGKQYMETGDFENSDDDHDAYRERMIQEGEADSDSESEDEDFDFEKEQKKVKQADEEYASGSGSDVSEVGDSGQVCEQISYIYVFQPRFVHPFCMSTVFFHSADKFFQKGCREFSSLVYCVEIIDYVHKEKRLFQHGTVVF